MKFCYCPAGSFMMGSPKSEKARKLNEEQVSVQLSKGFWMAQTEVTQKQWLAIMGTTLAQQKEMSEYRDDLTGVGNEQPMYFVNWEDAMSFVSKINQLLPINGMKFSLPTDAQWEYACRAGTQSVFHFGDALNGEQANCKNHYPYGTDTKGPWLEKTARVGSYQPNVWGLYDVHGNVSEWCTDFFAIKLPGGMDPQILTASLFSGHVLRGGAWSSFADECRSSARVNGGTSFRSNSIGFRLVLIPTI